MDEAGRVHIAAVKVALWDTPDTTDGIWYVTDRGRRRGDFGPRRRVAGVMMTGPSLRVVGGVRYLAYYRCLCGPGIAAAGGSTAVQARHPLFFKTDRTGRWTKELVADVGFYPSLRVGAEGRARIAYSDRSGVRFTSARTRLGDFTRPVRIPGSVEAHVSLALGDRGQPHVAWAGGSHRSQVAYSRRSREGWRSARLLGDGTDAELSIDAAGRPHVAFARTTSVVHRWLRRDGWARQVIARTVRTRSIDVRAFGRRANIVWAQWNRPMGVWITPPTD